MRVLHLYSDWRWTGPAEPVLNLVRALRDRGLDVALACRKPPEEANRSLLQKARERGIEPELDFHLNRYCPPRDTIEDIIRLPRYISDQGFDVVHTHLSHDHTLGGWAARRSGHPVTIVRTNHRGLAMKTGRVRDWLMRRYTDAYVGFSHAAAEKDREMLGLLPERSLVVNPAVDLDRFDPQRPYQDVRGKYGLGPEHVLAGIAARVQPHRGFDILLEAVRVAAAEVPNLRLLIIGKGSRRGAVAEEPARRMGLGRVVLFSGYRTHDYVDHLHSLDFKVFLAPGADGTCRAVREAMAVGKPVIAARRGMLPELVPQGKAGLIVEPNPEDLAKAMVRLAKDADLRRSLGAGAREHAVRHFRIEDQAEKVLEMYRRMLAETGEAGSAQAPGWSSAE